MTDFKFACCMVSTNVGCYYNGKNSGNCSNYIPATCKNISIPTITTAAR